MNAVILCLMQALTQTSPARSASPTESAELHAPVILGLFPPGVTVGGTTKWTLHGRNLESVARLRISGSGVDVLDQKLTTAGRLEVSIRTHAMATLGIRELRAEGPSGLSNLVLFRVDSLDPIEESEPNDDLAHANALSLNAVASGVLGDRDVDHVRLKGRVGNPLTVEVEARRLGTPVTPVLTLLDGAGHALVQARETAGLEGDCRVTSRFPADGTVIVRVHDALYQGGETASYRLRSFTTPFATAFFPLGGPPGKPIDVWVSGGTLDVPLRQRIVLPDRPGSFVELAPFEGPGGPLVTPHRLIVGAGPNLVETRTGPRDGSGTRLPRGSTADGWIATPGEVDRYRVGVRRGERLRVGIQAATLGSWLDSVVTVRDDQGRRIAENDDPMEDASTLVPAWSQGRGAFPTDSMLVQEAEADGDWLIEVADRYGNGGAEFTYRLTVEPARADFLVVYQSDLESGESGGNPRVREEARGPAGVLNLAPGSRRRVLMRMTGEGRLGPIVLRATGLPPGVSAVPVTIRPEQGGGRVQAGPSRVTKLAAALLLEVADNAEPALGELRVTATSRLPVGVSLERVATGWVPLGQGQGDEARPARPVFRELRALPVKVLAAPNSQ